MNANQEFYLIAKLSASTENITLCILNQIAGWDREALEEFDRQYRLFFRRVLGKDRKALKEIEQTAKEMDLHLMIDMEDGGSGRDLCARTWRLCVKAALTVLRQANDAKALKAVMADYDQWIDAVHEGGDPERRKAAYEILNETMRYMGREEVIP